jgi:hypothetical protein
MGSAATPSADAKQCGRATSANLVADSRSNGVRTETAPAVQGTYTGPRRMSRWEVVGVRRFLLESPLHRYMAFQAVRQWATSSCLINRTCPPAGACARCYGGGSLPTFAPAGAPVYPARASSGN